MRHTKRVAAALLAAMMLTPMTASAAEWGEVWQKLQDGKSFTTEDGKTSVEKRADGSYVISGGSIGGFVSLNENTAPSNGTLEIRFQNVSLVRISVDNGTKGKRLNVTLDERTSAQRVSVGARDGGSVRVVNAGNVTGQAPNEGLICNVMGEGSYGELVNAETGVIAGQVVSFAGNGGNQKIENNGVVMRDMRTGSCYYGEGGRKDFTDMENKVGGSTHTVNNGTVNGWLSIQAGGKGNVGTLINNGTANEMVDNNAEMWGKLTVINNGTVKGHFGGWGAGGPAELHVTNGKDGTTGLISVDSYDGGICSVTNDGRVNGGVGVYIEAETEPATLTVTNNAVIDGNLRVGLGKNSVGKVYNQRNATVYGNLYVWSNGTNAELWSVNKGRFLPSGFGFGSVKLPTFMFAPVALAEDEGGDKTDPGKPGAGLLVADDTLGGSVHIENYGWAEGVKLGNTATFAQFDGSSGRIESTQAAYQTPGDEKKGDDILAQIEASADPTNDEMLAQLKALGITAREGEYQVLVKTKGAGGAAEYAIRKVRIPKGGLNLDTSTLPKTGDAAKPILWGMALLACAGAAIGMKKRKKA